MTTKQTEFSAIEGAGSRKVLVLHGWALDSTVWLGSRWCANTRDFTWAYFDFPAYGVNRALPPADGVDGMAQAALDATLSYMKERQAFGRPIAEFQALQFRLADMEIALQSARIFLRQAAWKLDTGAPDATKFCAMAKKLVTETGSQVADQCLQLHGGYGYLADYGVEKTVRDLRVHQILEGTNEIMRLIVARSLVGR